MALPEPHFAHHRSRSAGHPQSATFVELSQLRRLRQCRQVAAVCYREGRNGVEFLLVQTRGSRRWTFPKGGVEPGLTHAEAAALEAFEEAGVHGRMEEAPFAQYVRRRRIGKKGCRTREELVSAHLCEVLCQGPPEESRRNPKWFSPEAAKRRLREDRPSDFGAELVRVTDLAVAHIQASRRSMFTAVHEMPIDEMPIDEMPIDELQRVRFESVVETNHHRGEGIASFSRYVRGASGGVAVSAHLSKILQFVSPQPFPQNRFLVAGNPPAATGKKRRTVDSDAT